MIVKSELKTQEAAMNISFGGYSYTEDTRPVIKQIESYYGEVLAKHATEHHAFERFSQLLLHLRAMHPAVPAIEPSHRYDAKTKTYTLDVVLAYVALVSSDWVTRLSAVTDGCIKSAELIAESRITNDERQQLKGIFEATNSALVKSPPEPLALAGPVFLSLDAAGTIVGVGFEKSPFELPGYSTVEVPPELAHEFTAVTNRNSDKPEMFKLYRKTGDQLLYREAWWHDGMVVEHLGTCGEQGEIIEHLANTPEEAEVVLGRLKKKAEADGYKQISPDDRATIVVEVPIDGFGEMSDLELRHKLEEHLNEAIGWVGLGHCDGGSIGSGSMEIFMDVVDYELGKSWLDAEVAKLNLNKPASIYRWS